MPSFIEYTQNTIKIMTNDVTLAGTYVFKVAASLDTIHPSVKFYDESITFQV